MTQQKKQRKKRKKKSEVVMKREVFLYEGREKKRKVGLVFDHFM
jgi:hypothetical protein